MMFSVIMDLSVSELREQFAFTWPNRAWAVDIAWGRRDGMAEYSAGGIQRCGKLYRAKHRYGKQIGRTNIPEAAKLSAVLVDGAWSWPLITDMECIEILHLLPTIHNGTDSILWRGGSFSTKAVYDIFHIPGPQVAMAITWEGYVLCCRELETHEHLFFRCSFSRQCIRILKESVRFSWPNRAWERDINWASRRWNGRHIVQAAYRSLLAAIVYHIWQEHNRRVFHHIERTSPTIARIAVDEIRQKILTTDLPDSVSSRGLYQLWRIPWPVRGTA
ncbi:hypothetical protein Sango_3109800 [Sesamum angolense]|uniref:Reverse transcriptase zinc-binding domain-containing protein n=1 Tax=Sesamum angolense TaxID=2727404 RepID=A0AAE1T9Z7_9LAMI|nr:hypothetical protein Sango_3109800 [Sesamum angolense]